MIATTSATLDAHRAIRDAERDVVLHAELYIGELAAWRERPDDPIRKVSLTLADDGLRDAVENLHRVREEWT